MQFTAKNKKRKRCFITKKHYFCRKIAVNYVCNSKKKQAPT